MTRTTVSLPDDLATLLAREARRRETSVSDIVRRAVETFLGASGERPVRAPAHRARRREDPHGRMGTCSPSLTPGRFMPSWTRTTPITRAVVRHSSRLDIA